jgi:hypothetical protein
MKLHQRHRLINTLDETGLQLTAEGSNRVSAATHGERGETMTAVACVE